MWISQETLQKALRWNKNIILKKILKKRQLKGCRFFIDDAIRLSLYNALPVFKQIEHYIDIIYYE